MKIISGKLKSRSFNSPGGHRTHPMSDKLRAAIFNVLGDIEGFNVLDVFSGSGAIAFEAISRGASDAVLLEQDKRAIKTIQDNIETLGLSDRAKLVPAYAHSWSTRNKKQKFNLIFIDPPFDNLQEKTIGKMSDHLEDGGLLILNYPSRDRPPYELNHLDLVKWREHGKAKLLFYKN